MERGVEMDVGMITCCYSMLIFNYREEESSGVDWDTVCAKWRMEFNEEDFLKLAREIHGLGCSCLEIWEPSFSYRVYTCEQAAAMGDKLRGIGFKKIIYCIGGWSAGDIPEIDKEYAFAKALGAEMLTGCLRQADAPEIITELERAGEKYDALFALENHPLPNVESPLKVAELIKDCKYVGANIDSGHYNTMCYDLLAGAEILKDKLYHVHCKDTNKGSGECLIIGEGSAPIAEFLRKLAEWDYQHVLSLEYGSSGDPTPGLVKSLAYMNDILK